MPKGSSSDQHERSAAGLDFEESDGVFGSASALGSKLMEGGPGALFEEVENLLPEEWKEHIRAFPVTAVLLGAGIGFWLGMKKGDEILAAGGTLVTTAAMANVAQVMERMKPQEEAD